MKVRELIATLSHRDPDADIYVTVSTDNGTMKISISGPLLRTFEDDDRDIQFIAEG